MYIKKSIKLTKPLLCYDVIFKAVFTGNENILAKMISDITGMDYKLLENNITLESNELSISKNNEKAKRCDFVIKVGKDNIINIELNRQSYTGLIVRNLSYIFNIFSTNFMKGEKYNDNLIVTQINIDAFDSTNKVLSKYSIREELDNDVYSKNLIIYFLNVVKAKKV